MVISWYGEGCFKVQSADLTILTDPFDTKIGLSAPRLKADITIKTIASFPPLEPETSEGFFIVGTGEYNLKKADITGLPLPKESTSGFLKTIYLVDVEGIKLCFLGHISETPEPTVLAHLEEVDILFIPAGGKPFIDQKSAVKLIKHLEPSLAILSFFKVQGLKRQTADVKDFLEEFGSKKTEAQEKISIKKKDLFEIKTTQIAVLKN